MLRIAAIVVAAALAGAASANASDVAFAYHAAELQSDVGRAALHDRMVVAVRDFCMIESRRSLKAFRNERNCIAELSGKLVERIGDPSLASLHAAGR